MDVCDYVLVVVVIEQDLDRLLLVALLERKNERNVVLSTVLYLHGLPLYKPLFLLTSLLLFRLADQVLGAAQGLLSAIKNALDSMIEDDDGLCVRLQHHLLCIVGRDAAVPEDIRIEICRLMPDSFSLYVIRPAEIGVLRKRP